MQHNVLLQMVQSVIKSISNTAVASVQEIKRFLSEVTLKVQVQNPQKEVEVTGKVEVSNHQPLVDIIKGVILALNGLKKPILADKKVSVTNFKDLKFPPFPRFPEFPKTVEVSNPQKEVKITNIKEFTEAVERVAEFVAKIKYDPRIEVNPPTVKVAAPVVNVPEQKPPVVNVEAPDLSDLTKIVEFLNALGEKNPIPVRLSDGKKFYKALEKMAEIYAGSNFSAFRDASGQESAALIDDERHMQVDVVTAPEPTKDIDFITRSVIKNILRLNTDASGRLRVASESTTLAANQDIRTLTNLTNWGLLSATSRTQLDANQAYQQGFRRNLVVT